MTITACTLTILALAYTMIVYVGNKGAFVADRYQIGAWAVAVVAWIIWSLLR